MEEKPIKPEYGQLTRDCRIFATLNYFLILAIFVLVFAKLSGLNLPKYYPLLREWSILPLKGPAMGYFGAVGFSLLVALPLAILFYWFLPFLQRYQEIRYKTFKNLTLAFLLFGLLFFVAKEYKSWGIEKMGLKSESFLGPELWLFLAILFLFLILFKILLVLEKKIFE